MLVWWLPLVIAWAAAGTIPADNLIDAATQGDQTTVQTLLEKGAWLTAGRQTARLLSWPPAGTAACKVVHTLIIKGADVNAKDSVGATSLMRAADNDRLDVAKALLAKGADVNIPANNRATAAMMKTNVKVHAVIIQAGSTP